MSHTPVDTRLGMDEDQGFQPGFSQRRPIFARELLKLLGVEREPREAQRKAVRDWLSENTPGRSLLRSLRRTRLTGHL
jgi:hypothetical protein